MSIIQQFNDSLCKVMEGKPKEEQNKTMEMLANAFKQNPSCQECSLKVLVNKLEPQAKCTKCKKIFLVEEIKNSDGCPDCHQKTEFEINEVKKQEKE